MQKKKLPRDPNSLAARIVAMSTEQSEPNLSAIEPAAKPAATPDKEKNPAAVALGRLGGLKGGKARSEMLSKERKSEIAKAGATARWRRKNPAT